MRGSSKLSLPFSLGARWNSGQDIPSPLFLIVAHLQECITLVFIKPSYRAPKTDQERRSVFEILGLCLVQTLPKNIPKAFNGVQIWRALGEVTDHWATRPLQSNKIDFMPEALLMILDKMTRSVRKLSRQKSEKDKKSDAKN